MFIVKVLVPGPIQPEKIVDIKYVSVIAADEEQAMTIAFRVCVDRKEKDYSELRNHATVINIRNISQDLANFALRMQ